MKIKARIIKRSAALLLAFVMLAASGCEGNVPPGKNLSPMTTDDGDSASGQFGDPVAEVRGIYIATVYNLDYPTKAGLDPAALADELDSIVDTTEALGCNAIYFQVRGASDAMYDSEIFPVSEYLTGTPNGELPDGFDPLLYLLEKAHARGIAVHAWVNPLRVTRGGKVEKPKTDTALLPDKSPAKAHPEWTLAYAGELYYDPGVPEARELVADGVYEIVSRYDVDGVLFDDYFYPYPVDGCVLDDGATYEKYGGGEDINDWRRENINKMVELVYKAVKDADPSCRFGIAPFGIWQNDDGKNGGSKTRGFQSYLNIYCDTLAWVRGGYIDYIAPQIYWSFSREAAPFGVIADWWCAQLDGTGVELLISHAAYKYGTDEWKYAATVSEMSEQIKYGRRLFDYRGSILYGYSELSLDTEGVADEVADSFSEDVFYVTPISTGEPITVSQPQNGAVVSENTVTIHGRSAPESPVYCNGQKISRRQEGEFYLTVSLKVGKNVFVFESGGNKLEFILTYEG